MSYSQAEKLQIAMLCEIYRKLNITDSYDPDIIEEAISSQNYWAINWQYSSISDGKDIPEQVTLFVDVIDMYEILKYTYDNLNDEDKQQVAAAVSYFDEKTSLTFPGFDGNNESEYLGIGHMFKLMGNFEGSNLTKNSHSPRATIYRRMLEVFLPARNDDWTDGVGISKESLIATLKAKKNPSKP